MAGGEPMVDQPTVNGHAISWNPDDGRYYVHPAEDRATPAIATFKEFRNAVQYAKRH